MNSQWTPEQDAAFQAADAELVRLLNGVSARAKELASCNPAQYADEDGTAISTAHGWLLEILLTWICENADTPAAPNAVRLNVQHMFQTIMRSDYNSNAVLGEFLQDYMPAHTQEA